MAGIPCLEQTGYFSLREYIMKGCGQEQNVNWKLTPECAGQQYWAQTVILISRDNSKVVLKRKHKVFFKYLFNVNGLGLPKMTFYAGMRSLRGKSD
jgi:hypothetical protein